MQLASRGTHSIEPSYSGSYLGSKERNKDGNFSAVGLVSPEP